MQFTIRPLEVWEYFVFIIRGNAGSHGVEFEAPCKGERLHGVVVTTCPAVLLDEYYHMSS